MNASADGCSCVSWDEAPFMPGTSSEKTAAPIVSIGMEYEMEFVIDAGTAALCHMDPGIC